MSRWVARWSVEIPGGAVDAVTYRMELNAPTVHSSWECSHR